MKCPYCKEDQILIKSLNYGDIAWEDEYGCYWKRVSDATPDEIQTAVISRDYCFKCSCCGSVLQHRYCNHELIRQMEESKRKLKERINLEKKKEQHPTLFPR